MFEGFVREGELRRWLPWVGAVLLVLVAVALETSLESVCWDDEVARAAKVNEAASCFEFWLNRYQTLITGIFAAIAAVIAFRAAKYSQYQMEAARDQVKEARLQSRAALQQSYVASFEFFSERMMRLERIKVATNRLINAAGEGAFITLSPERKYEREAFIIEFKEAHDKFRAECRDFSWRNGVSAYLLGSDADGIINLYEGSKNAYEIQKVTQQVHLTWADFRRRVLEMRHNRAVVDEIREEMAFARSEIDKLIPLVFGEGASTIDAWRYF